MLSARGSLIVIILTQSAPRAQTPHSSVLSALRANQNARGMEGRDAQMGYKSVSGHRFSKAEDKPDVIS